MSLETWDHGSHFAAGFVQCGADAAGSVVRGQGFVAAVRVGTGHMRLSLLQAVGAENVRIFATGVGAAFLAVTGVWVDPATIDVLMWDDAGAAADGACWISIYRQGDSEAGVVPVTE